MGSETRREIQRKWRSDEVVGAGVHETERRRFFLAFRQCRPFD